MLIDWIISIHLGILAEILPEILPDEEIPWPISARHRGSAGDVDGNERADAVQFNSTASGPPPLVFRPSGLPVIRNTTQKEERNYKEEKKNGNGRREGGEGWEEEEAPGRWMRISP